MDLQYQYALLQLSASLSSAERWKDLASKALAKLASDLVDAQEAMSLLKSEGKGEAQPGGVVQLRR